MVYKASSRKLTEATEQQQANEHEVDFLAGRKNLNTLGEDVTITEFNLPSADQTYMTVDDDDAEVAHVKASKPGPSLAKPPLKSALKKTSTIETAAKTGSAATLSTAPVKGRITLAEKKKREVRDATHYDDFSLYTLTQSMPSPRRKPLKSSSLCHWSIEVVVMW